MVVLDNLAPLVGCRNNDRRWNPYTGYKVVKNLEIAQLTCLNLNNDIYRKGHITYTFDSKITQKMYEIHTAVKKLDSNVLNPNYIVEMIDIDGEPIPMRELMFITSHNSNYNDSVIMDIFEKEKELTYWEYYQHVMFIMLDAFALRWSLYEYYIEGKELPISELRPTRVNRLIENIRYVKTKLEERDADIAINLIHHLSTLLFNVQSIKYFVSNKIIER